MAALALPIAAGVVVAIVLGVGSSSPSTKASASSFASGTTTVQRRDLVETDTQSGTLSYAHSHTVYNRLSGTITSLPSVGQVIRPGQALFRVAGQPVILMNGGTPAYRDLGPSDSDGQDILELNRNLVALGFNPGGIVIDNAWQAATTDGVDALQASLGQSETGTLKLGSVVFLPGDQIVSTVSAQLGSQAALRNAEPQPEFVSLTTTRTTPQTGQAPQGSMPSGKHGYHGQRTPPTTLAALLALLKAETAQLQAAEAQLRAAQSNPNHKNSGSPNSNGSPSSPSSGNKSPSSGNPSSGSGNGGGSATAVLTTSSTQLVATVQLDPSKQSEAHVGERVTVDMPSGNTMNGRVSAVSPVAQSSSSGNNGNGGAGAGNGNNGNNGSGSSTTIPVTITLSGHQSGAGLDQASVSVNFAQAKANNVLSVPVTALLATQGGGYAVQEAASPHHLVPVTAGLFAAGYVQVSGPGIHPGLVVTDSQG